MTHDEIRNVINAALKQVAPDAQPEVLGPDENYRATLDIDSFDTLRFIVAIAEKLQVEIPERDYGRITTMRELVDYVMQARQV